MERDIERLIAERLRRRQAEQAAEDGGRQAQIDREASLEARMQAVKDRVSGMMQDFAGVLKNNNIPTTNMFYFTGTSTSDRVSDRTTRPLHAGWRVGEPNNIYEEKYSNRWLDAPDSSVYAGTQGSALLESGVLVGWRTDSPRTPSSQPIGCYNHELEARTVGTDGRPTELRDPSAYIAHWQDRIAEWGADLMQNRSS